MRGDAAGCALLCVGVWVCGCVGVWVCGCVLPVPSRVGAGAKHEGSHNDRVMVIGNMSGHAVCTINYVFES